MPDQSGDLANPQQSTDAAADAAEEAAALSALLVGVRSGHGRAAAEQPRGRQRDGAEEPGGVLVRWQMHTDGVLTLEVTDGGATTRPLPASPRSPPRVAGA